VTKSTPLILNNHNRWTPKYPHQILSNQLTTIKGKVDIYENHNFAVKVRPAVKCNVSTKSVRNLRIFACSNGFLSTVFTDGRSLKSNKYMHTCFNFLHPVLFFKTLTKYQQVHSALLIKKTQMATSRFNIITITNIYSF